MNSPKFYLSGIVGGVVLFFLGYLFYGILLKDFFAEHGMATNMDTFVWWALVAGNILGGFLIAYVMEKGHVGSVVGGASTGFVVGLLVALSSGLVQYGVGHGTGLKAIAVDSLTFGVMCAVAGAVIGMLKR